MSFSRNGTELDLPRNHRKVQDHDFHQIDRLSPLLPSQSKFDSHYRDLFQASRRSGFATLFGQTTEWMHLSTSRRDRADFFPKDGIEEVLQDGQRKTIVS
jgi:hypothetical protein